MTGPGKLMSLEEAASLVPEGCLLGVGGFTIGRCPMAFTHALIRRGVGGLTLIGTNLSLPADLLIAAGLVAGVDAGTVSLGKAGLAHNFRRAAARGALRVEDNSHLGIISRLLAGEMGVPCMPLLANRGTDIERIKLAAKPPAAALVANPFADRGGPREMLLLPALRPQVSVLHVHEADPEGNARIEGCAFGELEMARASERVIVTAERIADPEVFRRDSGRATLAHIYVHAVAAAPWGAHPTSVYGLYQHDREHISDYQRRAREGGAAMEEYLERYVRGVGSWGDYLERALMPARMASLAREAREVMGG